MEIIELEKNAINYTIESLVDKCLKLNKIKVDISTRNKFIDAIRLVKCDISDTVIIRRGLRNKRKKDIAITIQKIIEKDGKPLKTGIIRDKLQKAGVSISILDLARLLNESKELFFYFGLGLWCLNKWKDKTLLGGSLIEIMERLIQCKNEPVHISEIEEKIFKFRKTTPSSILRTLYQAHGNRFVYFNCMYIGLAKRRYDKKWKKIPKVETAHFMLVNLKRISPNNLKRIPKKYEELYGYPKIHSEYLLKAKGLI